MHATRVVDKSWTANSPLSKISWPTLAAFTSVPNVLAQPLRYYRGCPFNYFGTHGNFFWQAAISLLH